MYCMTLQLARKGGAERGLIGVALDQDAGQHIAVPPRVTWVHTEQSGRSTSTGSGGSITALGTNASPPRTLRWMPLRPDPRRRGTRLGFKTRGDTMATRDVAQTGLAGA